MNEEEWGTLVARLEAKAREDPRGYGRRVLLLGVLGYLVICLVLAILVGLATIVLWFAITGHELLIKLVWPLVAIGYVLVTALNVRIDPPLGLPLSREEAPALFDMIDDVVEHVEGPRIDHVLLNDELNAFVSQIPRRFGIFGWTNYMVLGVPYMQVLGAEEYRAVVAHEVGHLSRTHGRAGTWIYRVQATWQQLLTALEERRSWIGWLFRRFFEWYSPYFAAYSFPLRRRHEYEADEAAAAAAGARPAATALLRAVMADAYLGREYWPELFERVKHEQFPPKDAFTGLEAAFARAATDARPAFWLRMSLDAPPAPHDTHPTVRQRVEHLGFDADELAREAAAKGGPGTSATQLYLGVLAQEVLTTFDGEWRRQVADEWQERHRELRKSKDRLEGLEAKREQGLSRAERAEHAYLVTTFRSKEAGIGLLRGFLRDEEDDPHIRLLLGETLLSSNDEAGLAEFDVAMELDPRVIPEAAWTAWTFLSERGRTDEAAAYQRRALAIMGELEAAQSERSRIGAEGPFAPHTVPDDVVERVRASLASIPGLKRAYLVRKPMEHLDEKLPVHVLFLELSKGWKLDGDVLDDLDFEGWVIAPNHRKLKRLRLGEIERATIYER